MPFPRSSWTSIIAIVLVTLAVHSICIAQEPESSFIISDGVGTVYTPPSHVAFWLHFSLPEGDLRRGLAAAKPIEGKLREFFANRELRPVATDIHPPHVASLKESRSEVTVELRFSMAGLMGGETGAAKFGELCEEIKVLGKKLVCSVSEPTMVIAEKNVAIQEAVHEATKQAFTAASGAAAALGSEIRTVERVKVLEITWNDPPDTEAAYPNIERVACTVRVRVTYVL
jgi:hypothetical protein